MLANREKGSLLVIDLQDSFLAPIRDRSRVLQRSCFLIETANLLGVPVLATEQNAEKMGGTNAQVLELLQNTAPRFDKLCFSSCQSEEFYQAWQRLNRSQVVIVGIESHICVLQTVADFRAKNVAVFLCVDAVSSRHPEYDTYAFNRMRDMGCIVTHTESIVYEWLQEAGTEQFRKLLPLIKKYASSHD